MFGKMKDFGGAAYNKASEMGDAAKNAMNQVNPYSEAGEANYKNAYNKASEIKGAVTDKSKELKSAAYNKAAGFGEAAMNKVSDFNELPNIKNTVDQHTNQIKNLENKIDNMN